MATWHIYKRNNPPSGGSSIEVAFPHIDDTTYTLYTDGADQKVKIPYEASPTVRGKKWLMDRDPDYVYVEDE